ncbi:MAG: HAD family hydrolase [Chitinophagaceae bacterium]|nr:HAD family hydrolase [Chitinophagaceae bacterium]
MEVNNLSEIVLQRIDLVLLDLDNTLYEYNSCHEKALAAVIDKASIHFRIERGHILELYMKYREMVYQRHRVTAASHSRLFYLQAMIEELCNTTDIEWVNLLYNLYWDVFIDEMTLFDDAIFFLHKCLAEKIPIVLVTDMIAEVQFKKVMKLKIGKYLKFIVTSEEAGVEKPHPFIFELAISKLDSQNKNIKKIVVIGDDKWKDVYSSPLYEVDLYHRVEN